MDLDICIYKINFQYVSVAKVVSVYFDPFLNSHVPYVPERLSSPKDLISKTCLGRLLALESFLILLANTLRLECFLIVFANLIEAVMLLRYVQ